MQLATWETSYRYPYSTPSSSRNLFSPSKRGKPWLNAKFWVLSLLIPLLGSQSIHPSFVDFPIGVYTQVLNPPPKQITRKQSIKPPSAGKRSSTVKRSPSLFVNERIRRAAQVISSTYNRPLSQSLKIASLIWKEAMRHKVDFDMVLAVVATESSFKPHSQSTMGAVGLMQVEPSSVPRSLRHANLWAIPTNIKAGVRILVQKLVASHFDWAQALAYYNGAYNPDCPYVANVYRHYYQFRQATLRT